MSSETERITNEVMDRLNFGKLSESGGKTYLQELEGPSRAATELLLTSRGFQGPEEESHEGPAEMR